VEFESMEELEQELHEAFERLPAPPSLKRDLMEKRRAWRSRKHIVLWQRLAASVALAAILGGVVGWRQREERRKGEEAREQVLTALRITSHALDKMNSQLAAHSRTQEQGE
jgi:type VI protein secretion system component VasK